MSKIKILIVLFNKEILESETLKSLQKFNAFFDTFDVLLWDNSLKPKQGQELDEYSTSIFPAELNYIHSPENKSLSYIYNYTINNHLDSSQYLLLLDDDTFIEPTFLEQLLPALNHQYDIYLPKILNNEVLVSPGKMFGFIGKYWPDIQEGLVQSPFIVAINSGMVISANYLKNTFKGYDERLTFYGTDTYFMKQAVINKASIYVLNIELHHDLSFFNPAVSLESKISRINSMVHALSVIFSKSSLMMRFALMMYIIMLKLKYALQFKTSKFLW